MNCEDFLRQFRDALDGKVSESVIQDNVNYYRAYIDSQTAGGRSESDVLRMLGDPRLLAKTIEESSKFASGNGSRNTGSFNGSGSYADPGYADRGPAKSADRDHAYAADEKRGRLPGWLITCIVVVVICLVLSVVFRVFVFLVPYIMVFLLAGFLVRTVRGWWQGRDL